MLGLGKKITARPLLKGRGVEIRHVLPLTISVLREHAGSIRGGRQILTSMISLQRAYTIIRTTPFHMSNDACDAMEYELKQCVINARDALAPLLPKFHLLPHLADQCRAAGNPTFASTIEDESLNGDTVRIAATSHTRDFLQRLLSKEQLLASLEHDLFNLDA